MNELTIEGKLYISSKRAAEMTGYAKDYVGQLCREGHVEARMVGRSWYVLESSIRGHRFGTEAQSTFQEANSSDSTSVLPDAYTAPTYIPENVPSMPIPTLQRLEEQEHEVSSSETLTDMQMAWKAWFAQRQDSLIESPEVIDAREEAHEQMLQEELEVAEPEAESMVEKERALYGADEEALESVPIHHVQEPLPAERVRIEAFEAVAMAPRRPQPPIYLAEESEVLPSKQDRKLARLQARKARSTRVGGKGTLIIQAVLFAVILSALVLTAIGTGYAAPFLSGNSITRPALDFLGGRRTYKKKKKSN